MGVDKKRSLEVAPSEPEIADVIPISSAHSYRPPEPNQEDVKEYDEIECARIAHELGLTVIRSKVGLVVKIGDQFPLVSDHLKSIGRLPE